MARIIRAGITWALVAERQPHPCGLSILRSTVARMEPEWTPRAGSSTAARVGAGAETGRRRADGPRAGLSAQLAQAIGDRLPGWRRDARVVRGQPRQQRGEHPRVRAHPGAGRQPGRDEPRRSDARLHEGGRTARRPADYVDPQPPARARRRLGGDHAADRRARPATRSSERSRSSSARHGCSRTSTRRCVSPRSSTALSESAGCGAPPRRAPRRSKRSSRASRSTRALAGRRLGYELDRQHTAVIAWLQAHEEGRDTHAAMEAAIAQVQERLGDAGGRVHSLGLLSTAAWIGTREPRRVPPAG